MTKHCQPWNRYDKQDRSYLNMYIIVITGVFFFNCLVILVNLQSILSSLTFYVTILKCVVGYTTHHDVTFFILLLKNYENLLTQPKYQFKLENTFNPSNHIATGLFVRYGLIFTIFTLSRQGNFFSNLVWWKFTHVFKRCLKPKLI